MSSATGSVGSPELGPLSGKSSHTMADGMPSRLAFWGGEAACEYQREAFPRVSANLFGLKRLDNNSFHNFAFLLVGNKFTVKGAILPAQLEFVD